LALVGGPHPLEFLRHPDRGHLARVEQRLSQLLPPPVRNFPILIGGTAVKRTLPLVAKHADIWHTFASVGEYRRKNAILKELAAERRTRRNADRAGGPLDRARKCRHVPPRGRHLIHHRNPPTEDGNDFSELKDMIAWRDQTHSGV
jgi:alkanesulfonate monooxygenase SsuD/methylene tetrahydromethanopterin reductase-like flavin-dependent oxidoreductase (luciferase family)